jgi:hypothetical protein
MNDELVSIAHLLLNELEASQSILDDILCGENFADTREQIEDNEAVITEARKILSKYPI